MLITRGSLRLLYGCPTYSLPIKGARPINERITTKCIVVSSVILVAVVGGPGSVGVLVV